MNDRQREPGIIRSYQAGREEHRGTHACWVFIDFEGGCQGFGGLTLDEGMLEDYKRDLCQAFGVERMDDLVSQECFALRCWSNVGEAIEGIESKRTGRRFTITGWRLKNGLKFGTPFEERRNSLEVELLSLQRRIREVKSALKTLGNGYINWSKQ